MTDYKPVQELLARAKWLPDKVIHEKHPVVLGGSPDDPANRVLVPANQHPALCIFSARPLREVRRRSRQAGRQDDLG